MRTGFLTDGPPVLFDVPVPHHSPTSSWTAEPYPIRKKQQGLELVLTRIAPARLPDRLRPRAHFEVRRGGQRTSAWVPSAIRVSDGAGNIDQLVELAVEEDGGVVFPGLCTHEPAWKLETWFAPANPARATPDLEWTARNVELAPAGEVAWSGQTLEKGGIAFELVGTAGTGNAEWKPGTYSVNSTPVVRVRTHLPPNDEGAALTLMKVTDPDGKVLLPRARNGQIPPTVTTWREYDASIVQHDFPLPLAAAHQKLNITFRVHRMRKVVYLCKP